MDMLASALALIPFCLLLFLAFSDRWVNRRPSAVGRWVTGLSTAQLAMAVIAVCVQQSSGQPVHGPLTPAGWLRESGFGPSIYFDGVSAVMFTLVSLIAAIICRYSLRYLDGDAKQGRYFRWTAITIGAVSLMILSGNLAMFAASWMLTSLGLHHLLLHDGERPGARRAAWTKFVISRAGDVALVTGIALTYARFQTLELAELFQAVTPNAAPVTGNDVSLALIGWLFVVAATLKSAQFPFHSWLPLTMETPTPVSALMHAGIVNAGGYLVIRLSPLLVQAPEALAALAWIGAVTAVFGSLSMMTQNSIKQSLAYSTIAQMGFMMLQCGLGTFTAAMYHLVAHSLYKAHAFLSTGSVVSQSLASKGAPRVAIDLRRNWIALAMSVALTTLSYAAISRWVRVDDGVVPAIVSNGSQAWIFGVTLCLGIATWAWNVLSLGTIQRFLVTSLGICGLCLAYLVGYVAIDAIVGSTMPRFVPAPASTVVVGFVLLAFFSLLMLHLALLRDRSPRWLQALRVHAANGFYVDAIIRRLAQQIAN